MSTTYMVAHHVVGLPTSLGGMAPMFVSLSRPVLLSLSQWTATGLCLWMVKGLALGSTNSLHGWPFMVGSFCLLQPLRDDLA